jgi:hypothetical protein
MPGKNLINAAKKRHLEMMDTVYISATHPMFNGYWEKYGNPFDETILDIAVFEAICYKEPKEFKPVQPKRWGIRIEALEFQTFPQFNLMEVDWTEEYVTEEANLADSGKLVMSKNAVIDAYKQARSKTKSYFSLLTSKTQSSSNDNQKVLSESSSPSPSKSAHSSECADSAQDSDDDNTSDVFMDALDDLHTEQLFPDADASTPNGSPPAEDVVLASIPISADEAVNKAKR